MRCLIVDDDATVRLELEHRLNGLPGFQVVASCASAAEAAVILMKENIELMFLDVQLPQMNGLEFLRTLDNQRPKIILITSNKEYAAEAFEYEVSDFLVKPFTDERFLRAVMRVARKQDAQPTANSTDHIFVKVNGLLEKVNFADITYIEAMSDYVQIYSGNRKLVVHTTMKNFEQSLPTQSFFRVHNSFIVRLDRIARIEDNAIIIDSKAIPVSRSRMKPLMERLHLL
jgi:DNA-binding LytR/AlgR family response regulator